MPANVNTLTSPFLQALRLDIGRHGGGNGRGGRSSQRVAKLGGNCGSDCHSNFRTRGTRRAPETKAPGEAKTQPNNKEKTMKHTFIEMGISSLFLIAHRLLAPAFSIKSAAKAGTVAADLALSSDDDFAIQAVGAEQPRSTLGATVAGVIEAARATGKKVVIVEGLDGVVRTITAGPSVSAGGADQFGGSTEGKIFGELTRDLIGDETEPAKVAPWTFADGPGFSGVNAEHVARKASIIAMLEPAKPRLSLASLIGKIEDLEAAEFIGVDQDGMGRVLLGREALGGGYAAPEVTITQDITPQASIDVAKLPFE